MTDRRIDGFEDGEKLPWLESAQDFDEARSGWSRIGLLVVAGIVLLAALGFAYSMMSRPSGGDGDGSLIAAPQGDYKVKPTDPGGMKMAGEGDSVYAATEGAVTNASVDLSRTMETPVAGKVVPSAPAPKAAGAPKVAAPVPEKAKPLLPSTAAPAAASSGGGGSVVQLGAYPTSVAADQAWSALSRRFPWLAPLGKSVQSAEVNGRSVSRLRVNAGSAMQARELCQRLKVAGESCFVAAD
ncbi:SPOR domain-containing protein [Sphingomonas sp. FW199]|uniref:SPOR domain-containing protein n=1 Tax=Sphingomonas sp. FW199 TaxID=3400217 RepID=UPI003CEC1C19